MFGAAAMSLSSFCVVSNALRLNLFNIRSAKNDRRIPSIDDIIIETTQDKENEQMFGKNKITLKIEGMMCGHCEARVKQALEALPEVVKADVSHEKGNAVVTVNDGASVDVLKQAVEAQGYKVV